MFSKFGKEKKLFRDNRFRVKYGTIDASKLNAIYIDIESWVQPTEITNFESTIRLLRRNIMCELSSHIDQNFFNKNFIVDLDLRASGMGLNKKSFMMLEITLYPKIKTKFNSDLVFNRVDDVTKFVVGILEKNKFKFNSTKHGIR